MMTDTLTREQIEAIAISDRMPTPKELMDLCDLALIGREVLPRPIEDAPKDADNLSPKYLYGNYRDQWRVMRWNDDRYSKKPRPFWDFVSLRTTDSRTSQPTHFIPLSSLPKPKATP